MRAFSREDETGVFTIDGAQSHGQRRSKAVVELRRAVAAAAIAAAAAQRGACRMAFRKLSAASTRAERAYKHLVATTSIEQSKARDVVETIHRVKRIVEHHCATAPRRRPRRHLWSV